MPQLNISRPLDLSERYFWLLDRVSGMNFVVFAEIADTLDEARLREALQKAQEAHPLLRAKICAHADGGLFFEPAEGRLEPDIIEVDAANWQAPIEQEMSYCFELNEAPLMRCRYLRFTDSRRSVLALNFHHPIADGRSGADLLREILQYVHSAGNFGNGAVHAPMHEAFPEKYRWKRRQEDFLALAQIRKQEIKRYGRPAPLQWLDQEQPQRLPRFIRIEVDAAELLARCREHGASVHGAFGAAQLTAQFKAMGTEEPQTLGFGSPADMRPHLEGGIPPTGLGLYASLLFANYRVGAQPFWDLAREISSDIKRQLARGDGHILFEQVQPNMFPPTEEGIAAFAQMALASPQSTMVSNIGVVDAFDDISAVETVSFTLCPVPYQILFSGVSTYRGRLIANLAYDAGKLAPAKAEILAKWIKECLESEGACG